MLTIHFLNVGKGNCTIIGHPSGRISIIDIDNSRIKSTERKLTDPIRYVKNFNITSVFRFVLTHPDMDHMSGLNELSNNVDIVNFWDTENNKIIDNSSWDESPYDQGDWKKYHSFKNREESPKYIINYRRDEGRYWTDDNITILSPSRNLVKKSNDTKEYNHLSYVLMVEHKGVKILLGGDASVEAWEDILNDCGRSLLKADILLASHHGSKNNIFKSVLEAISPDYVIVSVAEGVEYAYDFYSNLAKKDIYSTKYKNNIILEVDDYGRYRFTFQK